MKKLNYLLLGLAGLTLASCSQEDVVAPGSGDGNFSITVKLPADMGTRALGDGLAANTLVYAVYDVTNGTSSPLFSFQGEASFNNSLETTLNLNLITGKEYQLAFFACAPSALTNGATESVYTFYPEGTEEDPTPAITVNYDNMLGSANNADAYDCFYKMTDTYIVGKTDSPYEVMLTRPVAQINWGTSELGENNEIDVTFGTTGQYIQTNLVVSGLVYTQFDLFDGDVVEGSETEVTLFAAPNQAPIPTGTAFPVDPSTYDYVACQYLLAPVDGSACDLTLNIKNGANGGKGDQNIGIEVNNAPIQANYRTNIYGNLLSTNATFQITKDKIFAGEYNLPQAWDGTTITFPKASADGDTYTVSQGSDLAGLAAMVNGTNGQTATNFAGKTIELSSDVDLGGHSLMIGSASRSGSSAATGSKGFAGVFDGNGNTISNLQINGSSNASDAAAFIPWLNGANASVKNVTFENLQIDAPNNEQVGVVGLVTDGATVDGVNVTSGNITAKQAAGAIAGRVIKSGKITNCNNGANVSVSGYNCGGIVGAAYYTTDASTVMTISNCTNTGEISGPYGVGGIVGLSAANVTECKNEGAVSGSQNSIGGIIGEQRATGTVSGCVNSGNVEVTSDAGGTNYGAGGIIGWVRYANSGDSAYPYESSITVTGNTNQSNIIQGYSGVGGIVGMWYGSGTCTGNTNSATQIIAKNTFGAGIVGGSQWGDTGNYPNGLGQNNGGMLTVTQNTQNTPNDDIMAKSCGATIIYVNSPSNTSVSGNNIENENLPSYSF